MDWIGGVNTSHLLESTTRVVNFLKKDMSRFRCSIQPSCQIINSSRNFHFGYFLLLLLKVYDCELESTEPLKSALECVRTFALFRGKSVPNKKSKMKESIQQEAVAELKAMFRIHRGRRKSPNTIPSFKNVILSEMANRVKTIYPKVLLRAYFIRARHLKAKDLNKQVSC